jgi:hypothetical protein
VGFYNTGRLIILQHRDFRQIYAVYDCNKRLLVVLAGLFMAETTSTLVLMGLSVNHTPLGAGPDISSKYFDAIGSNEMTGCYAFGSQVHYFIWIPPLVFETILCLLMLYKAWRTYRDDWRNPLLNLLIRDRCVSCYVARRRHSSDGSQCSLLLDVRIYNICIVLALIMTSNRIFTILLVNCILWAVAGIQTGNFVEVAVR